MTWLIRGFLLMLCCTSVMAAQLSSIQYEIKKNRIVAVLNFDGSFSYHYFSLAHPERIVVDLKQARLQTRLTPVSNNDIITKIRSGRPDKETLRLVFDLKTPVKVHTKKTAKGLRLDFFKKNTRFNDKQAKTSTANKALARSPDKALREVVVVLDPGHGGKDPGAIGSARHKEKDVVLAIAKKLKALIDSHPDMRAILTRHGDYYVGLRERLNIARKHDADIFISIHADAFINRESNGVSVFALSPRGATSEAARWLAEKENYSELGGVNLSELDDQNGLVRTVLLDLSQTATIGASLEMGTQVLQSLDKITKLHHGGVEQARFVVLKSPDIPSILIETGFISNPREEKNLSSHAYQIRLSKAIYSGLQHYFTEHPPHGTRLERLSKFLHHIVKRGESLSSIAAHYSVSVKALKTENQLRSDILHAGQNLVVPKAWS